MESEGDYSLHIPRGAEYKWITFDLTWQQRESRGSAFFHPPYAKNQPKTKDLFGKAFPTILDQTHLEKANRILDTCCHIWWRGPLERMRANLLLGELILDQLVGLFADEEEIHSDLDRVERLAVQRLAVGVSVEDMAHWSGMHRSSFTRRYQELRGESPSQFLARKKIENAKRLMAKDLSLRNISESSGFKSTAAFSRSFKKETGFTPTEWRKKRSVELSKDL